MAFGAEAVIPVEIWIPTYRIKFFEEGENNAGKRENLDAIKEVREQGKYD